MCLAVYEKTAVICPFCGEEMAAYYYVVEEPDSLTQEEIEKWENDGYIVSEYEPEGHADGCFDGGCDHSIAGFIPETGDTEIIDDDFMEELYKEYPKNDSIPKEEDAHDIITGALLGFESAFEQLKKFRPNYVFKTDFISGGCGRVVFLFGADKQELNDE